MTPSTLEVPPWGGARSGRRGRQDLAAHRRQGQGPIAALHLVSAWATEQRIVLGQEAVDGKENEILAIPRLLEMLELTGMLVTIYAMGCQKAIAKTIRYKGADYLLPVKDNQPSLHEDIKVFFDEQREHAFADCKALFHETTDQDHGRLEIRRHWSTSDIAWLTERHPSGESGERVMP